MNKFRIRSLISIIIIAVAFFASSFFSLHIETREGDATIIKTGKHYFKLDFVGESGIKHPVYDISLSEKETKKNIQQNKINEETLLGFQKSIVLLKLSKITLISNALIALVLLFNMIPNIFDKQSKMNESQKKVYITLFVLILVGSIFVSIYKFNNMHKLESDLVVYYNSI
jgi:hypothetical protein